MEQIIGNLNDLLSAVQQLAHLEENKVRQAAAEKEDQLLAEAHKRAEQMRVDILAQAKARAAFMREQSSAALARQARSQYLLAREQWFVKVWEETEERLHALTQNLQEYASALQNLFLMAVRSLDANQLIVKLEAQGHKAVDREMLGHWQEHASRILGKEVTLELSPELLNAWGGLVVAVKDSTLQIDVTFASRLEIAKTELRESIFNTLMKRFE